MIPWKTLDRASAPGGSELTLHQRGQEYVIRVDGQDLMGSRQHGSEDALARLGCAGLCEKLHARVLVGGLGLGFTVRAALAQLGPDAELEVAELVPAVIAWNRGVLAPLAGAPLADRRVRVFEGDVAALLGKNRAYDAILLDVDNGPSALTAPANARLYGQQGLARARASLRPRGMLAVWSASDDPRFTARLARSGYEVRVERVAARHNATKRGGKRHVLWLARRIE